MPKRKVNDEQLVETNRILKKITNTNNPKLSEAEFGGTFTGDLRQLSNKPSKKQERPKRENPKSNPRELGKEELKMPNE